MSLGMPLGLSEPLGIAEGLRVSDEGDVLGSVLGIKDEAADNEGTVEGAEDIEGAED
jgi:hypothetical protein